MDIKDYSIGSGIDAAELVHQMEAAGFQATNVARAAKLMRKMKDEKAFTVLAFTANMVASGLRGTFAKLVKEKQVDMIITTGGAVEHDFIRAFGSYELGDFNLNDKELNSKGINRIGNILVPNARYELLEKKLKPVFEKFKDSIVSPSEFISEMAKHVEDENSILYWARKNDIPIYSPGITDSAIGLQCYFFKQDHKEFGIDVTKDMQELEDHILNADKTAGIILGGGISKHHAIGVNILRGGLDYALYVTTAFPYDGSLSGATTNEAKSWSKIQSEANTVTVYADASIAFPLIVASFSAMK